MNIIQVRSESDIPTDFCAIREARKKSHVWIREPRAPHEEFHVSWGNLQAVPGIDFVVCNDANPDGEYPIKTDEFRRTYEETEPGSGKYCKKVRNRLVKIPAGWSATVHSREGVEEAEAGDWIAFDTRGCPYAQSQEFVESSLEFIEAHTDQCR